MNDTPLLLNVGCGPFRAPHPWVNVDVIRVEGVIEPDVVNPSGRPADLPADLCDASAVYMGHVLEHVPWDRVPSFLDEVNQRMASGGELCVVCPDLFRVVDSHRHLLEAVMENDDHYQQVDTDWPEARHHWNAYEARIVRAVTAAGFVDVDGVNMKDLARSWPIVSRVRWQCAVTGRKP